MRTGLLAKKVGMTRIFDELGNHHPATVLECPDAYVLSAKSGGRNIQIATFEGKEKNINKPQISNFKKLNISPKKYIREFRVSDSSKINPADIITVEHFVKGQYIDVRGRTIGKGFAGGMKRHGFGGLEATHGVSISHRSHGSTGQCQDPGRVFKGKKMAGQMGNTNVTIQNLQILDIDSQNKLIYVKGAVPGKPGAILTVADSIKKALPKDAPLPAFIKNLKNKDDNSNKEEESNVEKNNKD